MSGIVGVFHRDGQPVAGPAVHRMIAAIAHRGVDAQDAWLNGNVGLGHCALWTTPEAMHESQPLAAASGSLAITADVRLDNRDELLARLQLDARDSAHIGDAHLLLEAYRKWGAECVEHLLGDFAFVIWDGTRQRLFCARDHAGVKPFYYASHGQAFLFGSEAKSLLTWGVSTELNEFRVADYLMGIYSDASSTFYKDIHRLPPAHTLFVTSDDIRLSRYWALDPEKEIRLGSDGEYAEGFLEIFTEAVRCRMRSASGVGSMLSGGLDSSAISAVAGLLKRQSGEGLLPTYSAIFDGAKECDEREYINSVLAQGDMAPTFVDGDRYGPWSQLEDILGYQDEPFFAPNIALSWALNQAIKSNGNQVMLDGFDGDTVVSHGIGYLGELASKRRWFALAKELPALVDTYQSSFAKTYFAYLWNCGIGPPIVRTRGFRLMRKGIHALTSRRSGQKLAAERLNRRQTSAVLNPDFARRTGAAERHREWARRGLTPSSTERDAHHKSLTGFHQPAALEVLDKTAAAFSLEFRYPFWDKRLMEFCLAIPPEQKLRNGFGRSVMRRALEGLLADPVRLRRTKTNFLPNLVQGMAVREPDLGEGLMKTSETIASEFVDMKAVKEVYGDFLRAPHKTKPTALFAIWRVMCFGYWLQHHAEAVTSWQREGVMVM